MKNKLFIAIAALGVMLAAGCKKDEVPPRTSGYIIDYNFDAPTFLTDSERAVLDAKRDEWEKL